MHGWAIYARLDQAWLVLVSQVLGLACETRLVSRCQTAFFFYIQGWEKGLVNNLYHFVLQICSFFGSLLGRSCTDSNKGLYNGSAIIQ